MMFKQRLHPIALFLLVLAAATGLLVAAGLAEPAPRQDGNSGVVAPAATAAFSPAVRPRARA